MADGSAARVVSPVLVGREEQLTRLLEAALRSPSVVVVEGEAGIGKTRLVGELVAHPHLAGRLVLSQATALLHGLAGRPADAVAIETLSACMTLSRGDIDQAGQRLDDVIRRALRGGDFQLLPMAVTAVLRLTTARGEADAGVTATAEAVATCERPGRGR